MGIAFQLMFLVNTKAEAIAKKQERWNISLAFILNESPSRLLHSRTHSRFHKVIVKVLLWSRLRGIYLNHFGFLRQVSKDTKRTLRGLYAFFIFPPLLETKTLRIYLQSVGWRLVWERKNKEESKRKKKNMKELRPRKGPSKPLKSIWKKILVFDGVKSKQQQQQKCSKNKLNGKSFNLAMAK